MNSNDYGVPQSREKVYIVGFKKDLRWFSFKFPDKIEPSFSLVNYLDEESKDVLEDENRTFHRYLISIIKENTYTYIW